MKSSSYKDLTKRWSVDSFLPISRAYIFCGRYFNTNYFIYFMIFLTFTELLLHRMRGIAATVFMITRGMSQRVTSIWIGQKDFGDFLLETVKYYGRNTCKLNYDFKNLQEVRKHTIQLLLNKWRLFVFLPLASTKTENINTSVV